jgi:hypothetical protein
MTGAVCGQTVVWTHGLVEAEAVAHFELVVQAVEIVQQQVATMALLLTLAEQQVRAF